MIPLLLLLAVAIACTAVAVALVEPRRERADSRPEHIAQERAYFDAISRHPAGKKRS